MSDSSWAPQSEPSRGLPVVQPPSGKFIAQLFLVPLLIVSVLVCFTLLIKWWAGSAWSPEEYLAKLDDPNPDVRWRGAEGLAQVLLRDDHLASDPRFALELAERLRRTLQTNLADEKAALDRLRQSQPAERDREMNRLQPERDRLLYLSACLGNLILPIGAPVLSDMAVAPEGSDPKAVFQRRRYALWALVSLGKNQKRLEELPESRREQVFAMLEEEAAASPGSRQELAEKTLNYLRGSHKDSLESLGVDKALTRCAEDENPFLREITALALNFWEGTGPENEKMNALLAKLDRDNGHGEDILNRYREEDNQAEIPETKVPGMTISFNATVALAHRGSDRVRLGVLRKMLNEPYLRENLLLRSKDGQEKADESLIAKVMEAALQAIAELHRKRPERSLSDLYAAIEEVTQSSNAALRVEAKRTLQALGK
ncbi:MAG TPA: hypothetical protein VGY66_33335 [Gemmataceae bacterium]|nr:hypothetical protein [Gemmataceae bacterium]